MSLVAAFFNGIQFNMQKMHQIWTPDFLQVVRQHILGAVDNVTTVW